MNIKPVLTRSTTALRHHIVIFGITLLLSIPVTLADVFFVSLPSQQLPPVNHSSRTILDQVKSTRSVDYLSMIDDIESQYGPYSDQLPQHLVSLGMNLQQNQEHDAAIKVFKRAMHLHRINEGLYNANQVSILEHTVNSQIALRQWNAVNDNYQYIKWLHQRTDGKNSLTMLPAIQNLSDWHLEAAMSDAEGKRFFHLTRAHDLLILSTDIIYQYKDQHDLQLVANLRNLTTVNYYLHQFSSQSESQLRSASVGSVEDNKPQKNRLEGYTFGNFNRGRSAIEHIITIYEHTPNQDPLDYYQARLELADWHLLFNKRNTAQSLYESIYNDMLANKVTTETINEVFAHPVILPSKYFDSQNIRTKEKGKEAYVLVRYDVTSYGRTRNIEIKETNPFNDQLLRSSVYRTLKQARFRPRFVNGTAMYTEGLTHKYVFMSQVDQNQHANHKDSSQHD